MVWIFVWMKRSFPFVRARRWSRWLPLTLLALLSGLALLCIYLRRLTGEGKPRFLQFDVCNGFANQRISVVMGLMIGEALVRLPAQYCTSITTPHLPTGQDRYSTKPLNLRSSKRFGWICCRRGGAHHTVQLCVRHREFAESFWIPSSRRIATTVPEC